MALNLVNANIVRQQAYNAVYGTSKSTLKVSPYNYYAMKALFIHLQMFAGNPALQLVGIDGFINSSNGGNTADQVLANAPCTLYAVFLKKNGSTETVLKGANSASTCATDGTQDLAFALTSSGTELIVYPDGRAYSAGLTVTENTDRVNNTLTLSANRIDGFVIIGQ